MENNLKSAMVEQPLPALTFGQHLCNLRRSRNFSRREFAKSVGLSAAYLSEIEAGGAKPPPGETIARILSALQPDEIDRRALLWLAASGRGSTEIDERLPTEIRALIYDIRKYADLIPERFARGLRTAVREAVK